MDELLAVVAEDVIETQGKTKPRAIHTKTALRIRRDRQSPPLEGSRQEAIPLPSTTFDIFSCCVPLGTLHPRLAIADASLFSCPWRRPNCAAPSTHQDQGSLTSRWPAKRPPLAPVVPQKTVGSLPCPIGSCAHMPWLPEGSRFHMAHGRGVARLHNPVGDPLTWVEVGTNQTVWFSTIFPTRLPPQPDWWLDLSQKLCGHQRASGLA